MRRHGGRGPEGAEAAACRVVPAARAVVRDVYGGPEVLRVEEVPTPEPGTQDVRVRVRAVGVCRGAARAARGRTGAEGTAVVAASVHGYRREDDTRSGPYGSVLDLVDVRPLGEARRCLAPDGVYGLAGGSARATFQATLPGRPLSWLGRGRLRFWMADESRAGLAELVVTG